MSDHNESNQNVAEIVSSSIDAAKEEILNQLKSKDPWSWRILSIVLPIIVTSLIGWFIFMGQTRIQNSINIESSKLAMRLNLAHDLYTQKFKVYMELYNSIVSLSSSLKDSRIHPEDRTHTHDNIEKLSNLSDSNKLIIGDTLYNILNDMWRSAIFSSPTEVMDIKYDSYSDFFKLKEKTEIQMRKDLLVKELEPSEVMIGNTQIDKK